MKRTHEEQKQFVITLLTQIFFGLFLIGGSLLINHWDHDCPVIVLMLGIVMVVQGFRAKSMLVG